MQVYLQVYQHQLQSQLGAQALDGFTCKKLFLQQNRTLFLEVQYVFHEVHFSDLDPSPTEELSAVRLARMSHFFGTFWD